MKTNIKVFAIIAVLVIGFAFSWTIAIVAGIVCEIGVFVVFCISLLTVCNLQDEVYKLKTRLNRLPMDYLNTLNNKEESK